MSERFAWRGMSADQNTVTLRRYDGVFPRPKYADEAWVNKNRDRITTAVALDVETTGLNTVSDKIIEIAVRPFRYHRDSGEILSVGNPYCALQDPGVALSAKVQQVTGLSDEMLKGQQIDWSRVEAELTPAGLLVAHNAAFDRPFLERYLPLTIDKVWACSLKQIDWEQKGFPSSRLDILSIYHGYFVQAHRALSDVDSLIYLLSMRTSANAPAYFREMLENARRPSVLILAKASPFETKDLLRERNYTWDPKARCWQKQTYKESLDGEIEWLEAAVYSGRFGGEIVEVPLSGTFRPCSS